MTMNTLVLKENPLVTVCITTYDRPRTLVQALESVIKQTYKNLEILVMDDCSPDNKTMILMASYLEKDKRIKYFKQVENKGVESNFNLALGKANGKYFLWLCDDDWISSSYIEECLKYKLENPEYAAVCGKTKFYWEDNFAFYGEVINIEENIGFKRVLVFNDQQLGTANSPNFGILEIEKVRNIRLKHILGHDNVWMSNIAFLGKIKTLDFVYIHRRLGGSSESLKKSALTFRHSYFEVKFPFIALWKNLFCDIAWESSVFNSLGGAKRLFLGFCLNTLIVVNLYKYVLRYKRVRSRFS